VPLWVLVRLLQQVGMWAEERYSAVSVAVLGGTHRLLKPLGLLRLLRLLRQEPEVLILQVLDWRVSPLPEHRPAYLLLALLALLALPILQVLDWRVSPLPGHRLACLLLALLRERLRHQ
jgi:hypothetical protein